MPGFWGSGTLVPGPDALGLVGAVAVGSALVFEAVGETAFEDASSPEEHATSATSNPTEAVAQ